jgi:hypothetical protein
MLVSLFEWVDHIPIIYHVCDEKSYQRIGTKSIGNDS